MVDHRSLHCHTTHLVSMQPAMLKTFPVHNELPSSPAHNSPPGLNTIRLTNSDHYSIYDNSFPLTVLPFHIWLKFLFIFYQNGMQPHPNPVTFTSLMINISMCHAWMCMQIKLKFIVNFLNRNWLPSTTPLMNFRSPVGSTARPESSTGPGASAQASPETGLGLCSLSTAGVSNVLSFWTIAQES